LTAWHSRDAFFRGLEFEALLSHRQGLDQPQQDWLPLFPWPPALVVARADFAACSQLFAMA
jgi:hypothetical protein